MMQIPCEVIQDLLPSYLDDLTSGKTKEVIREHIADCEVCEQVLRDMKGTENGLRDSVAEEPDREREEIDFLKKNRRKNHRILLGSVLGALLMIGLLLLIRTYFIGFEPAGEWMDCSVQVDNQTLVLNAVSNDERLCIYDITYYQEESGTVYLRPKAVTASPFYPAGITRSYQLPYPITQIFLEDLVIWSEGKAISHMAASVYRTRHLYMGDMPANGRTANALHISDYLGNYLNELYSSSEPFCWVLELQQEISMEELTVVEYDMEVFGYILLGVIGNLDEVHYRYVADGKEKEKIITVDEADEFLGTSVKECMDHPAALHDLITRTGLERYLISH